MKIVLCLHHFLPEYIAGTEIYTFNLARNLIERGVDAIILIPNLGIEKTEEYNYEGVRVIKYAENSVEDRSMIMGEKKPVGLAEFISIIQIENPDIVHFHELGAGRVINIFHVEAVKQLKICIVLTFHLSYYSCFKGSLVYKDKKNCDGFIDIKRCVDCVYQSKKITGLKANILLGTSLFLYQSRLNFAKLNSPVGTALGFPFVIKKIKTDLVRLSDFAEKIVVLTDWYKKILLLNGIPSSKLMIIKQGLPGQDETKKSNKAMHDSLPLKVVFIGRINAFKGLHLLIEAICNLPEQEITLDIYGQESDEQYVNNCKLKAAKKGNIYWKGTVAQNKVISTLSNFDLLCLPSTFSEMSPLVIQEAFAAGIPVLASDVYGNAEQVTIGENGWLFKFNDAKDLQDKLEILINNIGLIKNTIGHFPITNSFKELTSSHVVLYEEIIKKHSFV